MEREQLVSVGFGNEQRLFALAASAGKLYAGGNFSVAGGSAAYAVAQWNGNSWSALSSGMDSTVFSLVVSGDTLYAGGSFRRAGGSAANYIARWNGTGWSGLGSGMNGYVEALAGARGQVVCGGGRFTTAGGKVSPYAAEAVLVWPPILSGPLHNGDGSMTLNCSTDTNYSTRVYAATNLTPPVLWQPICTNVTGGLWQFTDTNTAAYKRKFYRLSTP